MQCTDRNRIIIFYCKTFPSHLPLPLPGKWKLKQHPFECGIYSHHPDRKRGRPTKKSRNMPYSPLFLCFPELVGKYFCCLLRNRRDARGFRTTRRWVRSAALPAMLSPLIFICRWIMLTHSHLPASVVFSKVDVLWILSEKENYHRFSSTSRERGWKEGKMAGEEIRLMLYTDSSSSLSSSLVKVNSSSSCHHVHQLQNRERIIP